MGVMQKYIKNEQATQFLIGMMLKCEPRTQFLKGVMLKVQNMS